MKTRIIALATQKGGVAKTVTTINLGIGLARHGKKVLLVDCDPQGSLTISLGHARVSHGSAHIHRAATFNNNVTKIDKTKTKAGVRVVPIVDALMEKMGTPKDGYVLGGSKIWSESKFKRTWQRLQRDIPVLQGVSPHRLRHTYTMLLRRAGVDTATAQYLLGHEDYQTTANVYTHIVAEDLTEARGRFDALVPSLLPQV